MGDDLLTTWDYDVNAIIMNVNEGMKISRLIYHLEALLTARKKAQAKAERIESKIKANLRAIDSDEEDDGDAYDVEDEEEEEDGRKRVDKVTLHPLYQQANEILNECYGKLNALVLRPVPTSSLAVRTNLSMTWSLNNFEHFDMLARKEHSIDPESNIPSIPSPFITEEGKAKWDELLMPTTEEVHDPKGKKAPPKKDKKGAAGGGVDGETVDEYHKHMYNLVSQSILDCMETALCGENLDMSISLAAQREVAQNSSLEQVAALRDEDVVENRTVFVNFAGDAFLSVSSREEGGDLSVYPVYSGYDEISKLKKRSIDPVLSLVKHGARSIVLTHNSLKPTKSLLDSQEEICTLIQTMSPQMPMTGDREDRKLIKQRKKREKYLARAA